MSVAEAIPFSSSFFPSSRRLPSVLVVEDEKRLRETLVRQLSDFGIMSAVATTGYEAIRLAAARRPELILLDGLLPEMHGFDVARFVRKLDRDYDPYIVMVTGVYKTVRYHNDAKLKYGIDDYIVKPISASALDRIIDVVSAR